jgi:hypothetical protein
MGSTNRMFVIRAYIFPNFHIFRQFPFQIPYNLNHFFNSQLHLTIPFWLFNSLILQYLPHATHFPNFLPLSYYPQAVPTLPFIRLFGRLRRDILHQHLFLSGEVLCDTLRLIWRVCVRPSLCSPQWFPEITWERISNCVLLFGTITYRSSSNFSVIR